MFFERTNGRDATHVSNLIIHPKSQRDGPMSAQASGLGRDTAWNQNPKGVALNHKQTESSEIEYDAPYDESHRQS